MNRWMPSQVRTVTWTNLIQARHFVTSLPPQSAVMERLPPPSASPPALPVASTHQKLSNAFSTSACDSAETTKSGQTKEELITELARDPETKLILEALKKELEVPNKTDNHENGASDETDISNTNMSSSVEEPSEQTADADTDASPTTKT